MNNQNTFKLIDGIFAEPEAKEVLITLIENKIRYHQLKIVSDLERFGKIDEKSEERIKSLSKAKTAIADFLTQSSSDQGKFQINSEIRIERI